MGRTDVSSCGACGIPDKVFLDANFIVNFVFTKSAYHTQAALLLRALFQAADSGLSRLYTSPLVLDEVWWKLGEVLYDDEHAPQSWRRLRWRKRKDVLRRYRGQLHRVTRLVLANDLISVAPVTAADAWQALQHVTETETPHLAPRDALHLAVMKRLNIRGIATNDPDFAVDPSLVILSYAGMH